MRKIIMRKNEIESQVYITDSLFEGKNINSIQKKELETKSLELLEKVNIADNFDELNNLWIDFENFYSDLYSIVCKQ